MGGLLGREFESPHLHQEQYDTEDGYQSKEDKGEA